MSVDHAKVVLAAIIPDRKDRLLTALQHLEPDHFRVDTQRVLFTVLERYYNMTNGIISKKLMSDLLKRQGTDTTKVLLYEELFDEILTLEVADDEFKYSIDALKDIRAEQLTGEVITTSMEILERGVEIDKQEFRGHKDSRDYLYSQLSIIDKLGNAEVAPEGDMMRERAEIMQEYADKVSGKTQAGIQTGIPSFDRVSSGGFNNGELILACAYTGEGKTQFCAQTAWDVVVNQNKNVFFATTETVRSQIRRRIVARHSRQSQFDLPGGINVKDIKNGTLKPHEIEILQAVTDDFYNNEMYGKLNIVQIPRGGTLGFVESRLNRWASMERVDLVIIDYLALLRAEMRRQSEREEFTMLIRDAKQLATSHDSGRGAPVISPWAMSQTAWKKALEVGAYGLASLSDTSEAEKSPDQLIAMLRRPEQPNEVRMQFLKTRDGDIPPQFVLEADYRNAYLGEKYESDVLGLLEAS